VRGYGTARGSLIHARARWQLKQNVRPPNRLEFERQYATTFSDTATPHESQMASEVFSGSPGIDEAFGCACPPLGPGPVAVVAMLPAVVRPKRAAQSTVCGTWGAARARAMRSTVAAATMDVTRVATAAPMSFRSNDLLIVAYSC